MEELLKLRRQLLKELHEIKLRYEGSLATLELLQTRFEALEMSGGNEASSSSSEEAVVPPPAQVPHS